MLKVTEKGFTLIEVLVALTIAGAIMGVVTMTIMTMMQVGPKNNAQAIVFTQVQNAGLFISRDAMMTEAVVTDQPGTLVVLNWTDAQDVTHSIKYIFQGTTLMRQVDSGAMTLVAEYIDMASSTATWDSGRKKLTVTIKASFGGAQAQRTYEVTPRPT